MLSNLMFYLFFLLLPSFAPSAPMNDFDFRDEAARLGNIVIEEMEKEYSLRCIGTGGSMPYDLSGINIRFVAKREGSIDDARKIEVIAIEKLKKLIDENEKLRPYLAEFPFPPSRLEISLSYEKKNGDYYPDGALAYVSQINGIIRYKTNDSKTDRYVLLHEEPYDEAYKIVKEGKGASE